ncbi:MAG: hypothetical protein AB7U43_12840 [Desulfobacter sp.]
MLKTPEGRRIIYAIEAGKLEYSGEWPYPLPDKNLGIVDKVAWWNVNAQYFGVSFNYGMIDFEVFDALIVTSLKVDLAQEMVDPKKYKHLKNDERSKRYSQLTGGGIWAGKPYNNKSETVRDLLIAIKIKSVQSVREKHAIIHDELGDKYPKDNGSGTANNISKYRKRIEALLASFSDVDQQDLVKTLELLKSEGAKPSIDIIRKHAIMRPFFD